MGLKHLQYEALPDREKESFLAKELWMKDNYKVGSYEGLQTQISQKSSELLIKFSS